jgi:hypothetical protein
MTTKWMISNRTLSALTWPGQLMSATVRILTSISRTLWTTPSCSRAAFRLLFVEMVSLFPPDLQSLEAEFLESKARWKHRNARGSSLKRPDFWGGNT